jgi:nicotinamidase-related amidase
MLFELLVIDMQNDFIASAGLVGRSGCDVSAAQKLAEYLPDFIAAARRAGVLVIFIRNMYSTERNFYLSDSWLEQAARKQSGGYTRHICIDVLAHDAFHNTDLDTILRANAIRTVVLTSEPDREAP